MGVVGREHFLYLITSSVRVSLMGLIIYFGPNVGVLRKVPSKGTRVITPHVRSKKSRSWFTLSVCVYERQFMIEELLDFDRMLYFWTLIGKGPWTLNHGSGLKGGAFSLETRLLKRTLRDITHVHMNCKDIKYTIDKWDLNLGSRHFEACAAALHRMKKKNLMIHFFSSFVLLCMCFVEECTYQLVYVCGLQSIPVFIVITARLFIPSFSVLTDWVR